MNGPLEIGLVGAGSMGANHARVISGLAGARLAAIVDPDLERARALSELFGGTPAAGLEGVAHCDAVIVACTTETHAPVALALIAQGMPLLIEKPIADVIGTTKTVVEAARARGVALMCGFVERYNAVIATLRQILDEPPIHVLAVRHSPVNPRSVSSVALDLLIHDVDLVLTICDGREVAHVRGATWTSPGETTADIADCTMQFRDGAVATLSASRVGQRKIRTMQVDTGSWLYELDLLRQDITVYRNVTQGVVGDAAAYRAQTIIDIPFVRHTAEPLALELTNFLSLVTQQDAARIEAELNSILPPHGVVAQISGDVSKRAQRR
jgi:predicted dehydrogenase